MTQHAVLRRYLANEFMKNCIMKGDEERARLKTMWIGFYLQQKELDKYEAHCANREKNQSRYVDGERHIT